MPTVPQYNRNVQAQVGPTARVTTAAPDGAFGVGGLNAVQNGISVASNEINRVYAQEKQKADSLRVEAADNDLAQHVENLVYNPEDGLMTRRRGCSG